MRQFQVINRAIEAGVRIDVRAEAHSHSLEKFDEFTRRVMLAAVKGHVLEKVSETALVLLFVQGAGENEKAQGSAIAWFAIGEHNVAHAVLQLAETRRGIWLEITFLLRKQDGFRWGLFPGRGRRRESQEEEKAAKNPHWALCSPKKARLQVNKDPSTGRGRFNGSRTAAGTRPRQVPPRRSKRADRRSAIAPSRQKSLGARGNAHRARPIRPG